MKIEIDLNEILGDKNSVETLQKSVRRQVVDSLKFDIQKKIKQSVDKEISRVINKEIKNVCDIELPELLKDLIDTPYKPVSSYGEYGQETTIRKTLIETLEKQMQYTKKDNWGNRDKNYFTEHIDQIVATCMAEFNKSFKAQIDENFKKEALESAVKMLSEKLGIK